jgi:hypothetical protein
VLDTQNRGRVAVATAVAGGALAAVTIGAFASSGATVNSAYTGCGTGYDGYGYSTGYGDCGTPAPNPSPGASPTVAASPTAKPTVTPTTVPVPKCNPNGSNHTPSVTLDGGRIHKGQRKGLTARCLRPKRVVQVYALTADGKTTKFAKVTVNQYGTVRIFYKANVKGTLTLSFVGAQFDGKTLRKKFHTSVL